MVSKSPHPELTVAVAVPPSQEERFDLLIGMHPVEQ